MFPFLLLSAVHLVGKKHQDADDNFLVTDIIGPLCSCEKAKSLYGIVGCSSVTSVLFLYDSSPWPACGICDSGLIAIYFLPGIVLSSLQVVCQIILPNAL